VTDFSAMPELCFGGWKVPGMLIYTSPGAQMAIPDVGAIVQALLASTARSEALRAQAREGAQAYDVKRVLADYLLPALDKIQTDVQRSKSRREKRLEKKQNGHARNPNPKNQHRAAKSRR
jgi:hypothetical protein